MPRLWKERTKEKGWKTSASAIELPVDQIRGLAPGSLDCAEVATPEPLADFRRSVPGCIDASDGESRRILKLFRDQQDLQKKKTCILLHCSNLRNLATFLQFVFAEFA